MSTQKELNRGPAKAISSVNVAEVETLMKQGTDPLAV